VRTALKGFRAAAANARLLGWLLAANLALAACAVSPLLRPLDETLSRNPEAAGLARRFDTSWWLDVTTSRADAISAVLDAAGAAALLSALLGCFFAGGLLQAYHDTLGGLPMDRFMTSCRRWAGRFAWLFALSLPLYWLVHRMLNYHLVLALDRFMEGVADERVGLAISLGRSMMFLLCFDAVTLVADYARVHAIVKGERSMLASLSSGMRFVVLHPWRAGSLEAMAVGLQLIALAVSLPLSNLVERGGGTLWGVLLALAAGQAFLLLRFFLRESAHAAQVASYRDFLASSR